MIKVKATQKQAETGISRSSFETGVEKFSSLPTAFGMMLVGLAVYLKGIVVGGTPVAPAQEGPKVVPADSEPAASGNGEGAFMRAIIERAEDEHLVDGQDGGRDGDVIHLTSHSGFRARLAESFLPDQAPPIDVPPLAPVDTTPRSRVALGEDSMAFNDNARFGSTAAASGGGGVGGGIVSSTGGGGSSSGQGEGPGGQDNGPRRNRAPVLSGPVVLRDVKGCESVFIPLAALLAGAVDPDGDVLRILNITASAGELRVVDGGYEYTPPHDGQGNVTIRFQIGDAEFSVAQVATFQLLDADPIVGTDGGDCLIGTACRDLIDGQAGDDSIAGLAAADIILGGEGDDVIDAGAGDDTVFGGAGDDSILAGAGNDIVWAGDGDDTVLGQGGADMLMGEAGNDSLSGGDGDDQAFGDVGNDSLAGDAGRDMLDGGEGDDLLAGGDGADFLVGGAGSDTVNGGIGDDVMVADADGAPDAYNGGEGRDRLDYGGVKAALTIDFTTGTVTGTQVGQDSFTSVEVIVAGAGDDVVRFGTTAVAVAGGEGDDVFDFSALAARLAPAEAPAAPETASASEDSESPNAPSIDDVLAALAAAPAPVQQAPLTVQEILDFAVGDRIRLGGYSIRMSVDDDEGYARIRADDGSELRLEVRQLDQGIQDEGSPFRVRIEERDGDSRTIVEVYIDSLDDPDFAIALQGVQALSYYQG